MTAYVETFSHYGALQPEVKFLSCLVDEQGRDCVHLKQVGPGRRRHLATYLMQKKLTCTQCQWRCQAQAGCSCCRNFQRLSWPCCQCFCGRTVWFWSQHPLLDSRKVQGPVRVLSAKPTARTLTTCYPGEKENFDNVSCSRYLAARRVVAKKLCILVDGEVGQVNQRVAQVLRLQTEFLSCKSEEKASCVKYFWELCLVFTSPIKINFKKLPHQTIFVEVNAQWIDACH